MVKILENDFSWSLQRFAMFERCKREYFYHYYGSWEGWNEAASERTKLIYRLKNIKTENNWLKSVIDMVLSSALKREIEFSLTSCKSHSIRTAYRDISELDRLEYLKDPKKLCLDSVYFNRESIKDLRESAAVRLESFWNILWENSLFKVIREKQYGDFISIGGLCDFVVNDIKIWANPGIIFLEKEKVFVVDIQLVPFIHENDFTSSMGLAALLIKETYKYFEGKICPKTLIVDKDKCCVFEEYLPISQISVLIVESSTAMNSYLTANKKAYEENFPQTREKEKCRTCRFKEACAA